MKFRKRVISTTVAVMGMVLIILSVWMAANRWIIQLDHDRRMRSLVSMTLRSKLLSMDLANHPDRLSEFRQDIAGSGAISEWAIVDRGGRIVAWSAVAEQAPPHMDEGLMRRKGYDIFVPLNSTGGRTWRIYARTPAERESIVSDLTEMFIVIALGTLFLITALYGLIDRLVLTPLDSVVTAAGEIERGGVPTKLRGADRADEVGVLVRSFNRMSAEVAESRHSLEARVAESVTRYRGAQRQLAVAQRLSATGKLAAGIAHEINNPLAGMINAARTIRRSHEDGTREAEYTEMILEGLDRIARIVSGMLKFSGGRDAATVEPVQLAAVVESALGFVTHRVRAEGVSLEVNVPDDLPEVMADRRELQQVVLNLVVNAADAVTEADAKSITISAREHGGRVELAVADSGAGMDEGVLAQAFDIFFTTKDPEVGTGLGLSVVHQIVSDHDGRIEIDSKPGEGTTVRVLLPAADDSRKAPDDAGRKETT